VWAKRCSQLIGDRALDFEMRWAGNAFDLQEEVAKRRHIQFLYFHIETNYCAERIRGLISPRNIA
jgi:hypothetical protein